MTKTKKIKFATGFLFLCLFIFSSSLHNYPSSFQQFMLCNEGRPLVAEGSPYVAGEILIKFKPFLKERLRGVLLSSFHLEQVIKISAFNVYQAKIAEWMTVEEMVYLVGQNPWVEYAQPNYIYHLAKTPNDPYFSDQYALYNSGQLIFQVPGTPGKSGADIKATAAWEETVGSEEVTVAVIDTGVDLDHPDLKNKMKSSGYDFINKDYDASDDNGHGTHAAGIAAAETDNKTGIAGVAWSCKILPVKVFDANGEGGTSDVISQGIKWAADNGADVMNLSFGGAGYDPILLEAIKYAFDKDLVIVAAAGNENSAVSYPAAFDSYCLAVAATDYFDLRWSLSNFGSQIDVAAPGVGILSTFPTKLTPSGFQPYAFGWGTSCAAPFVTGLAALIKSIKPWLKPAEIMDIIRYSADDVNSTQYKGKDYFVGYGRINMEKALVPLKIK